MRLPGAVAAGGRPTSRPASWTIEDATTDLCGLHRAPATEPGPSTLLGRPCDQAAARQSNVSPGILDRLLGHLLRPSAARNINVSYLTLDHSGFGFTTFDRNGGGHWPRRRGPPQNEDPEFRGDWPERHVCESPPDGPSQSLPRYRVRGGAFAAAGR